VKTLRAKNHPKKINLSVQLFEVKQLRYLPSMAWLDARMERFGYDESFRHTGMMFPVAVSSHEHKWVEKRIKIEPNNPDNTNIDKDGKIIEGLYVHVGHKRVKWALDNGYDLIEGYMITSTRERQLIKKYTHIPHDKIPK
jgi:hypothetical protein